MAITWSSPVANLYVGLECIQSPSVVSSSTTSVTDTWNIYLKNTSGWYYDDNVTAYIYTNDDENPKTIDYHYVAGSSGITQVKIGSVTVNYLTQVGATGSDNVTVQMGHLSSSTSTTNGPSVTAVNVIQSRSGTSQTSSNVPSPTNVTALRNSDTHTIVAWTIPNNAKWSGVQIQRQVHGGAFATVATVGGSATSWNDTNVSSNNSYTYRVAGINGSLISSYVPSSTVYTTPSAPTAVQAVKNGSNINLTWSDQSPSNTSWDIEDNGTIVATGIPNLPASYQVINPDATKSHTYQVRAVAGTIAGPWSSPSNTLQTAGPPSAPTNLTPNGPVQAANSTVVLSWQHNPVDGTAQSFYEVQYRVKGSTAWTTTGKTASTDSTYFLSTGADGTAYEWEVRTWGSFSDPSGWSAIAGFTVKTAPVITLIEPLNGAVIDKDYASVSWNYEQAGGDDLANWKLTYIDNAQPGVIYTLNGFPEDNCSVNDLQNGHTYTLWLTSTSTSGVVSNMLTSTFSVHFKEPPAPTINTTWNDGYIRVTAVAGQGDPQTVSMELQRSVNGEPFESLTTTTDSTLTYDDYTAPLVGTVVYRIVSTSALPSSGTTDVTMTKTLQDVGCDVIISGGPQFLEMCRLAVVTKRSYTGGRVRVLNNYSGRTYPVETSSTAINKAMAITAKILPPSSCIGADDSANMAALENLFDEPGPFLYRDTDGHTWFVSLSDLSGDLLFLGDVSFTATRVDVTMGDILANGGTMKDNLQIFEQYMSPRLVEVTPGEWRIVGGTTTETTAGESTWDSGVTQ